jgi:uncharacterized protein
MRSGSSSGRRALVSMAAGGLFAVLAGAVAAQQPLRVLLVTGGGYHDYDAQKGILTEGIAARANVTFTVDHEAGARSDARLTRHATDAWANDFDVVVYDICFADVTDAEYVERIVRAHVARQLPAVVLHCTMHSYNYRGDNPVWSMFLGVRTRRHQRQMPFTVEALAPEHPVMAGFAAPWRTPQGELYEILDVYPTATPLAHALGEESGQHHVNVWVNRFAGVRVFGTTIGHHNETVSTDTYLDLVARGLLWAVGRLDDDGRPAAGYGPRGEL